MNTRQESLKDEILVLQTHQGCREAFEELVQRWQKRLWLRAFRITKDEAASWDIVQETWQRVIRWLRRLDDPAAFPGWLFRITNNLAIDWIRKEVRRRDAHASYACSAKDTDAPSVSAFEGIQAALARLSSTDSEILTLFYFDELSLNEIAYMLGIPVGTAKSRLHYGRQAEDNSGGTAMTDDELDKQLADMFAHTASYNKEKHENMLQEVMNMYASKARWTNYITLAGNIVAVMAILFCFWQFSQTESLKTMLYMAIFILIFYETTVLLKLWWWTVSSRNTILKTLKEMQLQMAEMQAADNALDNDKQ